MDDPIRSCRDCGTLVHIEEATVFIGEVAESICDKCSNSNPLNLELVDEGDQTT